MKNLFRIFAVVCLIAFTVSCSKDDDPAEEDFFVGKYEGSITYENEDGDQESHDDGKIEVIKLGNNKKYDFKFSNGIPSLNNVEFEEEGDNTLINIDFEDGVQYIRINESTLKMHYSKDGQTWEANAER